MKTGNICYVSTKSKEGEIDCVRPAVVLCSEEESPFVVVAAITSNASYEDACNVINIEQECLKPGSVLLLNHVKTIEKDRVIDIIGELSSTEWAQVSKKLAELSI